MKNLSKLYFSFLTAVVLIMPFFLLANPDKPVKISICGLTDSAVNVEVITYPEYYIRIKRNTVNYKCKITDKQFAIDLPAYQQPVYISIYINYIKKKSVLLDLYVVEAGDSVYIQQDTDGIKFTGRSAAKFLCQYQIQNVKPKDSFLNEEATQDFYQYLKTRKIVSDTIYKIKNYILDSIRTFVSNSFYSLLKADLLNEKLQHQYILTDFVLRLMSRNPLKQQQVIEYYKDNLLQQEIFKPESSVSLISRCYIDAILSKFKLDGIMQHINYTAGHYTSSSPDFVCREIATRYSGRLKEKLLTTFFANQFNISDSTTTLINKAVEEVKHPYLQYILLEVQRKTKGVKAYDFHLSDSSGKMIKLSDFKGKAVLLDFWYTGCHWCTVLTKEIKPFVESNADTNIVFITISIDKNKEGWKESIKKGLYTSGNEINLYTNGMGNQHPLITYYMIHEYPNIFIINKQGKISSVQPTTISTGETAIVKLQKALNKALLENE